MIPFLLGPPATTSKTPGPTLRISDLDCQAQILNIHPQLWKEILAGSSSV